MPTVLIAEDEPAQRQALERQLLQCWPQARLVASCEDGLSALEAVVEQAPEVAFLDIRLPGCSGLEVARAVVAGGGTVVFTTAYDAYAVEAFETGAVDYLLKPIQPERLSRAVERLQQRRAVQADGMENLLALLRQRLHGGADAPATALQWISASVGDTIRLIGIDEVLYFQAQDKYVRVVTADAEALIRTPVKQLVAGLDSQVFWQVHRSVVVRVAAVHSVRKDELGRWQLHLRGRSEVLPVSAGFAQRFRAM